MTGVQGCFFYTHTNTSLLFWKVFFPVNHLANSLDCILFFVRVIATRVYYYLGSLFIVSLDTTLNNISKVGRAVQPLAKLKLKHATRRLSLLKTAHYNTQYARYITYLANFSSILSLFLSSAICFASWISLLVFKQNEQYKREYVYSKLYTKNTAKWDKTSFLPNQE